MTLTREQIEEGLQLEAADTRAMTAASHVTPEHAEYVSWLRGYGKDLLDIAARALPLPALRPEVSERQAEGEVRDLVQRLQAAGVNDWAPTHEDVLKAADTLSRQAASLATAEWDMSVVRDAIVRAVPDVTRKDQDKVSYGLVGAVHHLHKRAEAAEASLASAWAELEDISEDAVVGALTSEIWGEAIRLRGINHGADDAFDRARHMLHAQARRIRALASPRQERT